MEAVSKERVRELFDSGDFQEVMVQAERLLRVYPEDCEIRYLLGMAYIYEKRYEDAERVLSRAVMLDANSPELLLALSKLYLQVRKYRTAYEYLQRALQLSPESRDILLMLAHLYDETGQYPMAIEVYRRLADLYPEDAEVLNDFGVALLKEGLIDDALAKFERATELFPSFLEAWENIALVAEYKKVFNKAIEARKRVLMLRGSCEDFVALGNILMESGKYLQALRLLERAKNLYPESPSVHYGIAIVYLHEKNWRDALNELKVAETLGIEKNAEFYRAEVLIYFNLRLFEECLESAKVYERIAGKIAEDIYYLKVKSLMYLKRWKDVVEAIGDASDVKLVYLKGIALYKLNRYGESLQLLQKAFDAGVVNENICRQLARVYWLEGDRENSAKYWRKILEISPDDEEAHIALSRLSTGEQTDIKTVVNPEHIERHRMLARKYADKGMVKEAILEWRKVLLIDPYDLEALEEIGKQRE